VVLYCLQHMWALPRAETRPDAKWRNNEFFTLGKRWIYPWVLDGTGTVKTPDKLIRIEGAFCSSSSSHFDKGR
jgi:hypothetical protein